MIRFIPSFLFLFYSFTSFGQTTLIPDSTVPYSIKSAIMWSSGLHSEIVPGTRHYFTGSLSHSPLLIGGLNYKLSILDKLS